MKTETTPKAETESRTRIQAYSKSQLAGLYLPHIQSASARRTLRSWIAKNTALQAALAQTGYSENKTNSPARDIPTKPSCSLRHK